MNWVGEGDYRFIQTEIVLSSGVVLLSRSLVPKHCLLLVLRRSYSEEVAHA
jgi:hypothetical protein